MNVEITSSNLLSQESIIENCRKNIPYLIDKNLNFSRLMKKLIRENSIVLYQHEIYLHSVIPLFLYYDLKQIVHSKIGMYPIQLEDVGKFESCNSFTELEDSTLVSIYKKIKSITTSVDNEKLMYLLPMSNHVKSLMFLNIEDVYNLLSILLNKLQSKTKLKEFGTILLSKLNETNQYIFNEELLHIYKTRRL